jgi:hypothetical protein
MAILSIVALAAVTVWFKLWEPFSAVSVIGVVGLVVGGWLFSRKLLRTSWSGA